MPTNAQTKPLFAGLLLLAAAAAAVAPLAGCRSEAAEQKPKTAEAPQPQAAVAVETAPTDERPMPDYLLVTGTLLANRESKVAAGVAGKVLATHIERGDEVRKGQVLVEVDRRTISFNVAEAKASAEAAHAQRGQAKSDCERAKQLFATNAISKAEYDRNMTQCQATQAQAEAAEARAQSLSVGFGDAAIRAPFAGSITERDVNPGEYMQPATTVASIVQLDPLRLELSVPESAALEMKPGLNVEFHLASDESKRFNGVVRYVGPAVRRSSRDLLVEAVVDNKDRALIPGMFAAARVHTGDPKRVTVPAQAVRTDGSLHHVFAIANGKAEDRIVQLGETRGGRTAVLDGIRAGETVALNPAQLVDGQPVTTR